ncbi:MAG TPA: undecaprenyl-diphosphate phosphatase [Polyangiaceae bacterium]|nr:undecaprenyl-diphosphate phosphatase [Polyangiaceae bacterium]
MPLLDALWLGIVQGLTEFLPVSSDGHLALAHTFLKASSGEDLFFDLVLHLGTLLAVLLVFGKDLWRFTRESVAGLLAIPRLGLRGAFEAQEGLRVATLLLIATLPTAVIGLLLKKSVESHAFSTAAVAAMIVINGVTLWLSRYAPWLTPAGPGPLNELGITPVRAFVIGVAQGLAVLPGISRSGSTIVALLLLGAERERAAQFSFLLSVPAIVGAFVLTLDRESLALGLANPAPYVLGAVVAAVVGIVALKIVLGLLRRARFYHFAWYCWLLGGAVLVGLALRP